jgi:hypothetical protein
MTKDLLPSRKHSSKSAIARILRLRSRIRSPPQDLLDEFGEHAQLLAPPPRGKRGCGYGSSSQGGYGSSSYFGSSSYYNSTPTYGASYGYSSSSYYGQPNAAWLDSLG